MFRQSSARARFDMFHLHYSDVPSRFYQISLIHVYVPATGAVYILCFTCLNRLTVFFILSGQRLEHHSGPRIGSEKGPLFACQNLAGHLGIT